MCSVYEARTDSIAGYLWGRSLREAGTSGDALSPGEILARLSLLWYLFLSSQASMTMRNVEKYLEGFHSMLAARTLANAGNDALTHINTDSDGHAFGEQFCDFITEGKSFESLTEGEM